MLTDPEYEAAKKEKLPLLSPGEQSVWIEDTANLFFNEAGKPIPPINLTLYVDINDNKRAIDTHTFKEFFELLPEHKQLVKQEEKDNHD